MVHVEACQLLRDAMGLAYQTGKHLRLRLNDDLGQLNQLGHLVERLLAVKAGRKARSLALVCNERGLSRSAPALNKRFDEARTMTAGTIEEEAGTAKPLAGRTAPSDSRGGPGLPIL